MEVPDELETRRLAVFLAVSFGVAWAVGAYIYATGGLGQSTSLLPGVSVPRVLVLLVVGYMWAPALGNVVARLVTDEGRENHLLRLHLRERWRVWLAAWVGPVVLTLLGVGLYFATFPGRFSFAPIRELLGPQSPLSPATFVLVQVVQATLLAPVINAVATFGEEFGWRGYLLPKLLPLGRREAVLVSGVVWGVWHWPVIYMGYNYGVGYPGAPWTGMLAMVVFAVGVGAFLSWATLRSGSVWPAVVGHGSVNGIGAIGTFLVVGSPSPLLGPGATGVLVALPWLVVTVWLLADADRLAPVEPSG
ncbi:CPBP family intramembrane glutamic endopeptidase [Halospeciosus flavus]|uniref:CPBP family intramembrane glutamic endopeptidase n=1 Tax=Halospeciosus flavus TaxID=3032283 RepID=A0ABD5Z4Q2_9EURY|nr:CPBP family intramembrane glutamic endopeptidase [Halospeciosus flavus]